MSNIPQNTIPHKPCKECKLFFPVTKEYFTPYAKMSDGFRNICKECRRKARRTSEILPEGHKRCNGCKHLLPATTQFFNSDPGGKFGLRGQCRVCQSPYVCYPPAPEGCKRCAQCEKVFPATSEFFHSQINGKEGLRGACKACRSGESKEYERREEVKSRRYARRQTMQVKMKRRAYALRTAERIRQYHQRYRNTHQVEQKAYNRNRDARKREAAGKHTAQELRDQKSRQHNKCYYCKVKLGNGKGAWHADHIVPISKRGSNDISNIVIACPTCNMRKHDKLLHDWAEGGRLL